MTRVLRLNDKGQCPIDLVKPLTYKRDGRYYCTRCSRNFSLLTGEWVPSIAWVKPYTMRGSAAVVAARDSAGHSHDFVECKDNDSHVCGCGLSIATEDYWLEH